MFTLLQVRGAAADLAPFGGLGFDLSGVEALARGMAWRPLRVSASEIRVPWVSYQDIAPAAGYDLLLRLSREIRGR